MKILFMLLFIISCGKKPTEKPSTKDTNKDLVTDFESRSYDLDQKQFLNLFDLEFKGEVTFKSQTLPDLTLSFGSNVDYFNKSLQKKLVATSILKDENQYQKYLSYYRNPYKKVLACLNKSELHRLSNSITNKRLSFSLSNEFYFSFLIPEAKLLKSTYSFKFINPDNFSELQIDLGHGSYFSKKSYAPLLNSKNNFLSSPFCLVAEFENFDLKTPFRIIRYNKSLKIQDTSLITNESKYNRATRSFQSKELNPFDLLTNEDEIISFLSEDFNLEMNLNDIYDQISKKETKTLLSLPTSLNISNGEKVFLKGDFYKKFILPKNEVRSINCLTGHCHCREEISFEGAKSFDEKILGQDSLKVYYGAHIADSFISGNYAEFEVYKSFYSNLASNQKMKYEIEDTITYKEVRTYKKQGELESINGNCPKKETYYHSGKITIYAKNLRLTKSRLY